MEAVKKLFVITGLALATWVVPATETRAALIDLGGGGLTVIVPPELTVLPGQTVDVTANGLGIINYRADPPSTIVEQAVLTLDNEKTIFNGNTVEVVRGSYTGSFNTGRISVTARNLGPATYTAKLTIYVVETSNNGFPLNPLGSSITKTAEAKLIVKAPEPLTILGSGLALGFGAWLQKDFSRKRKKIN